ncbi:MAG TPA: hypothetical protein VH413_03580 [Verrucomicrobiae bacterium]|jgi:hypothetical protein|nr:hypothetical protein [Verrucomicrobiae bacterium]
MKAITILFEKLVPHLMLASAAVGVFVLMAVAIFFSILLENWYEKRHEKHEYVYRQRKVPMGWSRQTGKPAPTFGRLRPSWQPVHAPAK